MDIAKPAIAALVMWSPPIGHMKTTTNGEMTVEPIVSEQLANGFYNWNQFPELSIWNTKKSFVDYGRLMVLERY